MRRAEIKKAIDEHNISLVGVTYVDFAGVARMKPAASSEIESVLEDGVKTSRANLVLTTGDEIPRGTSVDISQGDLAVVPDLSTFAIPSYTPGVGRFMGDLREKDGRASELCPRDLYRRVLKKAASLGYLFEVGFEGEYHLVTRKGRRVIPADSTLTHSQEGFNLHEGLFSETVSALMSVNVKALKAHVEGGRGQVEIDVAHERGLKAADGIVYFKDAAHAVARTYGYLASFMPKIAHNWWGSGMHLHLSLWDKRGRNLFAGDEDPHAMGISKTAYYFTGGILAHISALAAVSSPSVNSYKRLLPGKWNADAIAYGPGGRGAAVRIPDERGRATRLECRFPDATCNPYIALACVLSCGLDGIERRVEPGEPLTFDASFLTDREIRRKGFALMPRSLREAVDALDRDSLLKRTMGRPLFDEYVRNKEQEVSQAADKVSQWELDRFVDLF